MSLAFVIAPAFAVVGGLAAATAAGLNAHRKRQGKPVSRAELQQDVAGFTFVASALAGGITGYLVASFAFWLVGPVQYDAMWKAVAHAWATPFAALAGAIAGGALVRRR